MKIMIFGFSGSGKSTLAKTLSNEYSLPILYIDKILYDAEWKKRSSDEIRESISSFLKTNKNWIIDGNAVSTMFYERAQLADKIVFMDLGRIQCYKNAKNRYKQFKCLDRESRPVNCKEKFDINYIWWLLVAGRKKSRTKHFDEIINKHSNKCIILKNKKDIHNLLNNMDAVFLK